MRLPLHDTPLSLPAEPPREAIARDEALLDLVERDGPPLVRWWISASPAIVLGLGLHHRLAALVDVARCRTDGIQVLERRAGGGALLLDRHTLCGAVCLPIDLLPSDLTESYRPLGDAICAGLRRLAVNARRVDVPEARADVAALKQREDAVANLLLSACYGALSPHEVMAGGMRKLVGLAQIRRRHAALFQFGVLLRDQSRLAAYLRVTDETTRERLQAELARRTIGLESLTARSAAEVAVAIADAMPFAR
jgi:lipoate-protein ligase A